MSRTDLEQSLKSGPKPVTHKSAKTGASRIVPVIVVFGTVTGFMALAWYAYQAGSQSVEDGDLLVVEADKSPMKEKPTDPGGMQFPNQDKTIFDTFSGTKPPAGKVERVLPKPEEPIKNMDLSDTKTWINEKLHHHSLSEGGEPQKGQPEQVIGNAAARPAEENKTAAAAPAPEKKGEKLTVADQPMFTVTPEQQTGRAKIIHITQNNAQQEAAEQKPVPAEPVTVDTVGKVSPDKDDAAKAAKEAAADKAAKDAAAKAAADKTAAAKAAADKTAAAKAAAEKAAKDKAAKEAADRVAAAKAKAAKNAGNFNVQLGAFHSQPEAMQAWGRMQKKFKQLNNMTPIVIKADLGSKGTYYRLRTGGFVSAGEAKAFCNSMSILGQACLVPSN